eukprot:gene3212-13229_t
MIDWEKQAGAGEKEGDFLLQEQRDNPEEFECFLGEDFNSYLRSMVKNGTWGDELTMRALSDSYGVIIRCITSDVSNWYLTYEPTEARMDREIFVTYIAPIHYNAIRRKSSLRHLSKSVGGSLRRLGSLNKNRSPSGIKVAVEDSPPPSPRPGTPRDINTGPVPSVSGNSPRPGTPRDYNWGPVPLISGNRSICCGRLPIPQPSAGDPQGL